jgi:hypothetical protein
MLGGAATRGVDALEDVGGASIAPLSGVTSTAELYAAAPVRHPC